jgi:hypothetical protein
MGTKTLTALAIAFSLALSTSQVFAQVAAPDKNPPGTNAPSQFDSQSRQSQRNGESLSDRLERSNGVIKPPEHADKDIHLTPPPTGDQMAVPPNSAEKNATPK